MFHTLATPVLSALILAAAASAEPQLQVADPHPSFSLNRL